MSDQNSMIEPIPTFRAVEQFERHYRQLYTRESQTYDQNRFGSPCGQSFNAGEQAMIWRLLGLPRGRTVLDVAAGTGRIAADLAERGLEVIAFDLTTSMLRQAQARAEAADLTRLRCVGGNGRMLPFEDGRFDAVISIRFLHLFPPAFYRPFVEEMWRVLRPGGVLLVQFESALGGAGAVWLRELYRRGVRGNKPRYYLWPRQVPRVFAGTAPVSLHGFSPFGGRFIRWFNPDGAERLERFVAMGKQSFLANHLFVRAVKPAADAG